MSHKTVYPTFSRSNYNLIVGILSDAGLFLNLAHMKTGRLFVCEVNKDLNVMAVVSNHLRSFADVIDLNVTEDKQIIWIQVK